MKKTKTKLNAEKRKLALKGFEKFFEQENNIYVVREKGIYHFREQWHKIIN